jgi:hypothetical protein
MFMKKRHSGTANDSQESLRCSFCNKDQHAVRKLIAGPTVFICDECIEVCNEIIADDARLAGAAQVKPNDLANVIGSGPEVGCALCGTPIIARRGLLIPNRGALCFACIGEIDEAVADLQASDP